MRSELLAKWSHCIHETTGTSSSQYAPATVIAPPVPSTEPEPVAVTVVSEELAAGQPEAAAASIAPGPVAVERAVICIDSPSPCGTDRRKRCRGEVSASEESDETWLEKNWKRYEVWSNPSVQSLWPKENNGILDLVWQRTDGRRTSEGRKLEHCIECLHRLCSDVFARSNHTEEDLKLSFEIENRLRDEFVRSVWFLTPKPRNRIVFVEKLAELLGPEEEERTRPRIHLSYKRAIVEKMTETDAFQSLTSKRRRRRKQRDRPRNSKSLPPKLEH